jgi:hypothetical protein
MSKKGKEVERQNARYPAAGICLWRLVLRVVHFFSQSNDLKTSMIRRQMVLLFHIDPISTSDKTYSLPRHHDFAMLVQRLNAYRMRLTHSYSSHGKPLRICKELVGLRR